MCMDDNIVAAFILGIKWEAWRQYFHAKPPHWKSTQFPEIQQRISKVSHQHQDLCESNLILQVSRVKDYESVPLLTDHLGELKKREALLWDTQNQTPIAFLSSLSFFLLAHPFHCGVFLFCFLPLQPGIIATWRFCDPEGWAEKNLKWLPYWLLTLTFLSSAVPDKIPDLWNCWGIIMSSLNTAWMPPFFKFSSFKGLKIQSSYSPVARTEQKNTLSVHSNTPQQQGDCH